MILISETSANAAPAGGSNFGTAMQTPLADLYVRVFVVPSSTPAPSAPGPTVLFSLLHVLLIVVVACAAASSSTTLVSTTTNPAMTVSTNSLLIPQFEDAFSTMVKSSKFTLLIVVASTAPLECCCELMD